MENNILKVPVYTECTVCRETAEVPIDIDFTLPDYCPAVSRIFKCAVNPRIASKSISGSSANIEGNFCVNIIYADADNRLCAYEYSAPFSRSFELEGEEKELRAVCRMRVEYVNCRAVTDRRIDLHGAAGITFRAVCRKAADIVTDYDDPDGQLRRESIPATTPMGEAEKYLMLEEEIEIGQAQLPVRMLIRYDTAVMVRECKLLNEKAIVKGEIVLTAIYNTDSEKLQSVRSVLPFSQLLEIPGAGEQCSCDAEVTVCSSELKPRTGVGGEIRSFSFSAKLLVCANAFCEREVEAVLDAYSRKRELDVKRSEITFRRICQKLTETCQCKTELSFSDTPLSGVADLWCNIINSSTRFENGDIIIEGKLSACVIALDENGAPVFFDKDVDFSCQYPIGDIEGAWCEPELQIRSVSYTMLGGDKVELRIEIGIFACIYSVKGIPVVTGLVPGDVRSDSADRSALTIYYASAGEDVWDIARRYRSSVDEICQINDIRDNRLTAAKMILVPMI